MSAYLIDDRGVRYPIDAARPATIGRQQGCDILIGDDSVSHLHASISANGSSFSLRDFHSSNGTLVNGCRLGADPVVLSDGDSIRFGRAHFGFRRDSSAIPTTYCTKCGAPVEPGLSRCRTCGAVRGGTHDAPTVARLSSEAWQVPDRAAVPVVAPPADYELALLLIPVAATFLLWFWIGNMSLLQGPQSTLGLLTTLTVLSTAAIAAAEANKIKMQRSRTLGTESPFGWFIGISLLWIVGYPMYLRKRRLFGLKDRCVVGIFVALVFFGSVVAIEWSIESAASDLQQKLGGAAGVSESQRTPSDSPVSNKELDNAMLMVRPGIADFGDTKVGDLLECLEKPPNRTRLVSESDRGYGRYAVRMQNEKGEWLDMNFRLAGPTALLESIQIGDGTSVDDWESLLVSVRQLSLACAAGAPSAATSP